MCSSRDRKLLSPRPATPLAARIWPTNGGWRPSPRRGYGRRLPSRPEPPARLDALALDADQRQSLTAIRSLGRRGLRVGAADSVRAPAFRSRWCRLVARLPDHAKGMDAQADAILALLRAVPTDVVLCADDGTIEAIRARRTEIERLTAPALAPEPGLAAAVSKPRTLEIAGRLGLATPRSVELRSTTEIRAALAETGLPAVVKPAMSWTDEGRLGPVAVVDVAGASDAVAGLLSADAGAILQEWIPGRREAVSLFAAHGRTWGRFAQVAHSMFPALGGSSVFRESIPLPADAAAAAERLIDAMGLTGYAEVEFRRDAGGRPVLMEVNPRLSASVEIAVRAGVDFPLLLYRWASGVPLVPCGGYRVGLRMRWLGGDLHRLLESARRRPGPDVLPPGRAMTRFLADFARPAAYDYVSVQDPVPMLAATRAMLADAGRSLLQAARPVTRRDSG